jgi:hypothetical protein
MRMTDPTAETLSLRAATVNNFKPADSHQFYALEVQRKQRAVHQACVRDLGKGRNAIALASNGDVKFSAEVAEGCKPSIR